MWLRFGVDENNKLIAIEEVPGGNTGLICPYCGGALIAKKGRVKEHHFAHREATCRMVIKREPRDLPTLPLYDSFNIFLSGKEIEQLNKLWHRHKSHKNGINQLEILPAFTREKLVEYEQHFNAYDSYRAYQFTDLGKIPVGALALADFNMVQEPLIMQKLALFEAAIFDNRGCVLPNPELSFRLTDLRIYTAQLRKILLSILYYLEVQADGQVFQKIGVTTRPIGTRLTEIKQDLRSHYEKVTITVLGTWCSRGNVEKYFKYKYTDFNYPIGSLTEYFKFDRKEDASSVKLDLDRMKPKVLLQFEQEIFEGKANPLEQLLCSQRATTHAIATTQSLADDERINHLQEVELARVFLSRPSSQLVIEGLYQGYSLQQAAQAASVPANVARRVLAVLLSTSDRG